VREADLDVLLQDGRPEDWNLFALADRVSVTKAQDAWIDEQ